MDQDEKVLKWRKQNPKCIFCRYYREEEFTQIFGFPYCAAKGSFPCGAKKCTLYDPEVG